MKLRKGRVQIEGKTVGIVEEIPGGHRFTYSPAWLKRRDAEPVSMTLPLRQEAFVTKDLHPFFQKSSSRRVAPGNRFPEAEIIQRG